MSGEAVQTTAFYENESEVVAMTESYQLPSIVYSSELEKYILIIYSVVVGVYISTSAIIIMLTVYKNPSVQNPHNFIIASYSMMDFVLNFPANIFFVVSIFLVDQVPRMMCHAMAPFSIVGFFTMCWLVGIMAYERYRYFIHPLTYTRDFSHQRTFILIGIVFGGAILFTLVTEVLIGRVYHTSIMHCHLPGTVYVNYIQIACFFLPSLIVSAFSMIKIWRLTRGQQIAPADENGNVQSRIPNMKVALKVLTLVSGLFWGSYFPAFVLRTVLFSSGYTWDDMDTRRILWPAIAIRLTNLCLTNFSSAANPIVYYMNNKDLRMAIRKTLGMKQKEGDLDNSTTYTESTNA